MYRWKQATHLKTCGHGQAAGTVSVVHASRQSMENNHRPVLDVLAIEVHTMIFIDSLPANNYNKAMHQIHTNFIFKTYNFIFD